jgi:hypothetical protein
MMDTQIQPLGQRFLDALATAPGDPRSYQIGNHLWTGLGSELMDSLHRQCPNSQAWMSVRPAFRASGYQWEWRFEISPQVILTKTGHAPDITAACEAAAACTAVFVLHTYLGETIAWFSENDNKWVAAIDGDKASLWVREEGEIAWSRDWAKGAAALALAGGELRGKAATLEAAMCAAVDAPERFKRACAALVAVLRAPASVGAQE